MASNARTDAQVWKSHDPLRPNDLASFSGQPQLTKELEVVLGAAKKADVLPDHILFVGPPGLGKTTLAHVVAHELGLPIVVTSGPSIDRPGTLASMIGAISEPSVFFVDEIHRLGRQIEEILYPVMEDQVLDLASGDGPNAITLRLDVKPLVVIGATTQEGMVSAPLRDRFGYKARLKVYDLDALTHIVQRSASLLELHLSDGAARIIAMRGRGTPRVANTWLRRVHDVALNQDARDVDEDLVLAALDLFRIDELGLDDLGRTILHTLCTQFAGGPVGLSTLAAAVGEAAITLEEAYEPYLLRQGLLTRTNRGRMATEATYAHLELTPPTSFLVAEAQLPLGNEDLVRIAEGGTGSIRDGDLRRFAQTMGVATPTKSAGVTHDDLLAYAKNRTSYMNDASE